MTGGKGTQGSSLGQMLQNILYLFIVSLLCWMLAAAAPFSLSPRTYSIPLASLAHVNPPPGWLGPPINFGDRCTLVDAAAILVYLGASQSQDALALQLSDATHYSTVKDGPPSSAYINLPWQRALLDTAIEHVARTAGIAVHAQTRLALDFGAAAAAIAQRYPVILNVYQTPDRLPSHSLLAYGYDTRAGRALLLVLDPNTQRSYWVGPETMWSWTVTSTFITFA
jgi:hypothetical protein